VLGKEIVSSGKHGDVQAKTAAEHLQSHSEDPRNSRRMPLTPRTDVEVELKRIEPETMDAPRVDL